MACGTPDEVLSTVIVMIKMFPFQWLKIGILAK